MNKLERLLRIPPIFFHTKESQEIVQSLCRCEQRAHKCQHASIKAGNCHTRDGSYDGFTMSFDEIFYKWDCIPYLALTIGRFITSLYLICILIIAMVELHNKRSWLSLYSSMIFLFTAGYMILNFLISLYCYCAKKVEIDSQETLRERSYSSIAAPESSVLVNKIHWVLSNMVHPLSLLTITYWFFEHSNNHLPHHLLNSEADVDYFSNYEPETDFEMFISINQHALSALLLFVDFMLSRIVMHFYHVFVSVATSLAYVLFHVIYYEVQGKPVYHVMDHHNKPTEAAAVYILMPFMATPVCHLTYVGIYEARDAIARKLGSGYDVNPKRPAPVTGVV